MARTQDIMVSSLQHPSPSASVLIVSGDRFNELELFYPYYRFCEAGLRVDVASPSGGDITGADGHVFRDTLKLDEVQAVDYVLLYLPGGKAPATLRKDEAVLDMARQFVVANKPVAAICHGPQILAAAQIIDGKRISAYPEVESELAEAGAQYVNTPLMEDGLFITARWPGDLPGHVAAAIRHIRASGALGAARTAA